MPTSIKFDNTELLNTSYIPRFVKHESAPERILNLADLSREDGAVLISDKYGPKRILVSGILTAASASALETAIDSFKELLSRQAKSLDISWEAGTRRYVATCSRHDFDRDHFHVLFVPWSAEFTVPSGEGKDTATTTALNDKAVTTTTPGSDSFEMAGSKGARPLIKVQGNNWPTGVKGVQFKNTDTGEKVVFTKNINWGNDLIVRFYCNEKQVTYDGGAESGAQPFYGVFPRFRVGTNHFEITAGGIVNQDGGVTGAGSGRLLSATAGRIAQSFEVPYTDQTFQGIQLLLDKTNSPGNITVRIETDNGNKPSGTLADANATFTIAAGDVSAVAGYVSKYSTNPFTLSANTKYWIVVSAAGVDGSNYYRWYYDTNKYPKGNGSYSNDSGTSWTDEPSSDYGFKLLYGGTGGLSAVKVTITYTKTYL